MLTVVLAAMFGAAQASAGQVEWIGCGGYRTPTSIAVVDRIAYASFAPNRAALDRNGTDMLDAFARQFDAPPGCRIVVQAHTDGAEGNDLHLARRRAVAVRAYLRRRGLRAPIIIEAVGNRRPVVETREGVGHQENRLVIVYVAD